MKFAASIAKFAAAAIVLALTAPAGAQTREVIIGTPGFTDIGGLNIITKAFEARKYKQKGNPGTKWIIVLAVAVALIGLFVAVSVGTRPARDGLEPVEPSDPDQLSEPPGQLASTSSLEGSP